MKLRLGTRGSELARTQSGHVADALRALGHDVEVVTIRSEGDVTTGSLVEAGGLGVFAATLRRALLAGEVDLAVHSLKDLPTAPVPGLLLGAIPTREDPADVLCARDGLTLATLPPGARVGTGSPRRVAQLLAVRPDLEIRDIRGNVDTRLGFVASGELDAVVLACAGLERLGRTEAITERLDLERFPTAPGQGCLAIEVRAGETPPGVDLLDHAPTRAAVLAERGVLAGLEAGCAAPLGATANADPTGLACSVTVYANDGSRRLTDARARLVDDEAALPQAASAVAAEIVEHLLDRGAADLVAASRP